MRWETRWRRGQNDGTLRRSLNGGRDGRSVGCQALLEAIRDQFGADLTVRHRWVARYVQRNVGADSHGGDVWPNHGYSRIVMAVARGRDSGGGTPFACVERFVITQ